jgi:MbtH protein
MNNNDREESKYRVVMNHEEQYSILVDDCTNPAGWRDTAKCGTKSECLAYINEKWTDMRPLSLRNQMDKRAEPREVDSSKSDDIDIEISERDRS